MTQSGVPTNSHLVHAHRHTPRACAHRLQAAEDHRVRLKLRVKQRLRVVVVAEVQAVGAHAIARRRAV